MGKQIKRRNQKFISRLITIICLAVFIYAAHGLLGVFLDYYQNRKMLSEVQDIYYRSTNTITVSAEEADQKSPTIRSGFDGLLKENEQVVGWITIEDTAIDYPILQSDNNVDFLTENFYGYDSVAGSIFLDYRNDITSTDANMIVYGHRMKDGSMFQHLTKFLNKDFFESHRTFTFDTLYDEYEAEIFAVYRTLVDFNYIQTDFQADDEFEQLLHGIQERSIFKTDIDIGPNDQILTLSTCDSSLDPDDGRLVVHAKLTKIN